MLPLAWAYSPSSWTTATAEGYEDICLGGFLASQKYRCVYVHVFMYPSPFTVLPTEASGCWPGPLEMITIIRISRHRHLLGVSEAARPPTKIRKNQLFLLFLPCCQHINELSLPLIQNSAGRTIVLLGVLSLHILVRNLYLFYCHKIY